MRIREIILRKFKRFEDLTVTRLPAEARLVVLAGPNGNGKSSLFDGLHLWRRYKAQIGWNEDRPYFLRDVTGNFDYGGYVVSFHPPEPQTIDEYAASLHIRSAYRNDAHVQLSQLSQQTPATKAVVIERLSHNDVGVTRNLQRLAGRSLADLHGDGPPNTTFGEYRERLHGRINSVFKSLGLPLVMNGLGNPLTEGTFHFAKGAVARYHYNNLSGGEKAIFDLVLDLIVTGAEFGPAVYCIDEPESHVNPNLHGALLQVLLDLVPADGQLWIATHSIGMLRKARDLQRNLPAGSVVFLDFDRDFDQPVVLEPILPDRKFWDRALATAVGDMAELVAPEVIVFCEGRNITLQAGKGTDARLYQKIFGPQYPEVEFTSLGSSTDVLGALGTNLSNVFAMIRGTRVIRLIDRDTRSPTEIEDAIADGVHVLSRRQIESFLFDDEILTKLCASIGQPGAVNEVLALKATHVAKAQERGHQPDDVKKWNAAFRADLCRLLTLHGATVEGFMLDVLAPLITPDTRVYQELRIGIFGA